MSRSARRAFALVDPLAVLAGRFRGRWLLDPSRSCLGEWAGDPDQRAAELNITRADAEGLAWTLVHEDEVGDVLSLLVADAPTDGGPTRAVLDERFVDLRVNAVGTDCFLILIGPLRAPRTIRRMTLLDADTLALYDVLDLDRPYEAETLVFDRVSDYPIVISG